jgi:hypothetical protein
MSRPHWRIRVEHYPHDGRENIGYELIHDPGEAGASLDGLWSAAKHAATAAWRERLDKDAKTPKGTDG